MKVFIDTNVYLDFYRSSKDSLEILDELERIKQHLLFPTQVYNEIKRNRITRLEKMITLFKESNKIGKYSTSIILNIEEFKELEEFKKQCKLKVDKIVEIMEEMKEDSSKDPVFVKIKDLYESSEVNKVGISEKSIENARKRQLLGNPPGSDKFSVCDEIIWENILESLKEDLVIVSRDNTYKKHLDILKEEYKAITGAELVVVLDMITKATKLIGEESKPEVVTLEQKQVENDLSSIIYMNIGDFQNPKERVNWQITWPAGEYTRKICSICGGNHWNGVICLTCGRRECDY